MSNHGITNYAQKQPYSLFNLFKINILGLFATIYRFAELGLWFSHLAR